MSADPRTVYDSRLVQAVFGGGAAILSDDHVNFMVENDVLRVTNDSQLRTSALLGALFRIGHLPWRGGSQKQIGALVGMEFTQGTTPILDAFQFGLGLEISPYLSVVAGFSLRKGEELSRGFEQAASATIDAEQKKGTAGYARFPLVTDGKYAPKDLERLDGLSLKDPAGQAYFTGSPIVESYNRSYFIGVVVPVNLRSLIGPPR